MSYHFKLFIVLCITWLLLSGIFDHTLLNLLGIVSCLFVTIIIYRFDIADNASHYSIFQPIKLIQYLFWLIWQIVRANLEVSKIILDPKLPISPLMKTLPISQTTDLGRTIYANSITLTPGTVAVLVEQDTILVHSLTEESYQDLASNEMDRRVTKLETAFTEGKAQ